MAEEQLLPPEVLASLQQKLLEMHPEMEGAEVTVARREERIRSDGVAAKVGLTEVAAPVPPRYTVTMRKDVETEDGVMLPLVVRITVDEQGRVIKGRGTR